MGYRQGLTPYLLDTHVWIWTLERESGLVGPRTRRLIDRAGDEDALRVSPLSAFEIAWLSMAGRLRLSRSTEQWVESALEPVGIRLAPLTVDAALDGGGMGREGVTDPIDRLLIATARHLDGILVTRDRRILAYAAESSAVRVHDAAR
jgi:PIN domain nuclease of toxin-antitoxin system